MKTRLPNRHNGGWRGGVLDCGSPVPLSAGHKPLISAQSASHRRVGAALGRAAQSEGRLQPKTWRQFVAVLVVAAFSSLPAFGQSYSIDWFTIDGGGGTS